MARYATEEGESVRRSDLDVSISEREELLVEAERIAHVGSWVWNVEDNRVAWSDELFRILGYDARVDLPSVDNFFAAVHPDDRARVQEASRHGVTHGAVQSVAHRVQHRDGTVRHVKMDGAYLFDSSGKLRRVVGTVIDVTESREAAERLERANRELEDVQAFAHLGSWTLDLRTGARRWSIEFFRILGLDPDTTTPGHDLFMSCLHPDDREQFRRLYQQAAETTQESSGYARIVRPDGTIRHVRLKGTGETDADGRPARLRGTMHDVTDLTLLQQRLAQAERLETVGRLAGGIAHDFNNIMTVIQSGSDLLGGSDPDVLRDIHKAVASARHLTSRLLAFGRQSTLNLRRVDPNQIVHETVQLVTRILGAHVTLHTQLASDVPATALDAELTSQALINLLLNARDAMPQGGDLYLSTHKRVIGSDTWAEIRVRDTGHGISDSIRERIFEPFFTTKADGRGSGLGLAMVHGAVEQQGGRIVVESGPGGTTFVLQFTAASEISTSSRSMRPKPAPEMRALTILVVEDQDSVLNVVRKTLERAGHRVIAASLPSEATALFTAHATEIDLVLSDLVMPEMFGTTLVERLAQLAPMPAVVFMTGYGAEAARDLTPEHIVVTKPFTTAELLGAIARGVRANQSDD